MAYLNSLSLGFWRGLFATVVFSTLAIGLSARADTVYLRAHQPDDPRTTVDGTTWETAFSNVVDAVTAAQEGDEIHVGAGVYVITATISLDAKTVQIYGGYPAAGGDTRDVAANTTIFTGDRDRDDIWQHVEPVLGEFRYVFTDTDRKVLTDDGKVSSPGDFTADYDGYAAKIVGTNTKRAFGAKNVNSYATHLRIAGVTFTGFYNDGSAQYGCAAEMSGFSSDSWARFEDCTFTGNRPYYGVLTMRGWSASNFRIDRCTFAYNYCSLNSTDAASCMWSESQFVVADCTFLSCLMSSTSAMANCFSFRSGNPVFLRNTFARCNYVSSSATAGDQGRANCIASWKSTGTLGVRQCVATNCLSASKFSGPGIALFSTKRTQASVAQDFRSNVVSRCRIEAIPSANSVHSLVEAYPYGASSEMGLLDCSFVSNSIVAVSTTATSGEYLLATVALSRYDIALRTVNCTFDSNVITAPDVQGVTAHRCRGIGWSGLSADTTGSANIGNCTFYGPDVSGVYDIVQIGNYCPSSFLVANCVLSSAGERAGGIYAGYPEKLKVVNCSIKNHLKIENATYVNLETDEVPLKRGQGPLTDEAALHPAARAPNLGVCNYDSGYAIATYGFVSHDAAGNVREKATALRGAINAYADGAGEKLALTIRREPLLSGTLSPAGGVRAVASGDAVSVTAVPGEDASFVGWYLPSGETYGEDPTNPKLSIAALDEDLILVAKFTLPPVTLTFDLLDGGTFNENGKTNIVVEAIPGMTFPSVPAFTESETRVVTGWTPKFPTLVPDEDATYTAIPVTKELRVIKIVPAGEAPAVQDGKTWATAYADVQTAITDAGAYQGEVWFKQGTYTLSRTVELKSNVKLLGGFAGENEVETPDGALRPTVITGDVKGNDKWTGGSTANIWNDGVFNAPVLGTSAWYPGGNQGDNLEMGFNTPVLATNVVFQGLSFTGFKKSAIYGNDAKGKDFQVKKCRFLANGGAIDNTTSAALRIQSGKVTVEDCEFIGNYHSIYTHYSAGKSIVTDCLFQGNVSKYGGACIHPWSGGAAYVTNCTFEANWAYGDGWRCGPTISTYGSGATIRVDNCRFYRNQARDKAMGIVVPFESDNVLFTRTRFVGNNCVTPTTGQPRAGGVFGMGNNSTLVVRDTEFTCNTNRVTDSLGNPIGGIVCTWGTALFANCSFDRNTHTLGFKAGGATAMFMLVYGSLTIVHCTIVPSCYRLTLSQIRK